MDAQVLQKPPLLYNIHEDQAVDIASLVLTPRQSCDLELILNGGFAPLKSFLSEKDYHSVLGNCRLSNGALWPMPVYLDVDASFAEKIAKDDRIALRDTEGLLLAVLTISDIWQADKPYEARAVFGTEDKDHPGVFHLFNHVKPFYISGTLHGIALPYHYDFQYLRHSPMQLRQRFQELGWQRIVAFQTRNPMHRAHQELTLRAAEQTGAHLLIHPVVGTTKPGDIDYVTRVKCYEHVLATYPSGLAMLSLLPLSMRMAGPREALWHALVRKNYGCTHFIVGRDHAGPGKNALGAPFYPPYEAQQWVQSFQQEMDLIIVPFQEMAYSLKEKRYFSMDAFPEHDEPQSISGTELRHSLQKGLPVPEWFSYPAVIEELRKTYPVKNKQGLTVFFTGLPCSGKSTLANYFIIKLRELTDRRISLLDGDVIRTHLSKGLGFSQEDREANIARVGFVAEEITKHGGIAVCSLVAPFEKARNLVRESVSAVGGFIEVFVSTPLNVCEARDRKGHYKKAREGHIQNFTGIQGPYEPPRAPDIIIDTTHIVPSEGIEILIKHLQSSGYI